MEDEAPRIRLQLLPAPLELTPLDPRKHPSSFAGIQRITNRLRQTGCRSIGFTPADDEVGAIALALQVAFAFGYLQGPTCNVLDANFARPQFFNSTPFNAAPADAFGIKTVWVAERVALSTPAVIASTLHFSDVARVVNRAKSVYDYVFTDLTGLARWGVHHSAHDLLDGVVIVAITNKTTEKDILLRSESIPPKQRLGVALVG